MADRGLNDVILMNDRDRLTFEYLKKIRPEIAILKAIRSIHENKKIYVSNLVKQLDIDIPEHIYHVTADPKKYLEILKKNIKR